MLKFLNRFTYVKPLAGSYNKSFIVKNKFTRSVWVAKFSIRLPGPNFTDLNQRALLAYRLSKLVKTCVPETKIIKSGDIEYSLEFMDYLKSITDEIVKDGLQITRFKGIVLNEFLKFNSLTNISNLDELLNNFVFNLWIGNYDKKNEDYVIDQDNKAWSIDYNLLGPGFPDNSLSLGGNAWSFKFENVADTGWCIGQILSSYLKEKNLIGIFNNEISKIENLKEENIKKSFKDLFFYREGTTDLINDVFMNFLLERKKTIREKVDLWIKAGYPRR